jgi:hypothetical protein
LRTASRRAARLIVSLVLLAGFALGSAGGVQAGEETPWYRSLWRRVRGKVPASPPATPPPPRAPAAAASPAPGEEPVERFSPEAAEALKQPVSELKERPDDLTVDDREGPLSTLTSDGYAGPDESRERTTEDEVLKREFPMPQTPVQKPAPRRPPPTSTSRRGPLIRTGGASRRAA